MYVSLKASNSRCKCELHFHGVRSRYNGAVDQMHEEDGDIYLLSTSLMGITKMCAILERVPSMTCLESAGSLSTITTDMFN